MNQEFAITLKPHWAYAVFHLGKDIENRSWKLPEKYENRRIWIHSGAVSKKSELVEFYDFLPCEKRPTISELNDFPHGAIVGSLELRSLPYYLAVENRWHMEEFNGWKINNTVLLPTPIPAKGKLNFWNCTELVKEVL